MYSYPADWIRPLPFILPKPKVSSAIALSLTTASATKRDCFGQENSSTRRVCPWQVIKISLPWKGSSLLDKKLEIPGLDKTVSQSRNSTNSINSSNSSNSIPSTYVPARNIIFLSFALSWAEAIGAGNIFIGANAIDYSGYPDCRPEFYRALVRAVNLGTKAGVEGRGFSIFTPLIKMTKGGIIKLGTRLRVPYELTWSCYQGGRKPCGKCDSCNFRAKGFREARAADPLIGKLEVGS